MSLYDLFETDKDLETDGIEIEMYDASGDTKVIFTIARAGGSNKKFSKEVTRLLKPHQHAFDRGTMDPKLMENIWTKVISKHVVLGWDGVYERDGVTVKPYTTENCIELLTDLPELQKVIMEEAQNASNFLDMERVDSGKKSATSSTGNSEEESKPTKSKKPQSKED